MDPAKVNPMIIPMRFLTLSLITTLAILLIVSVESRPSAAQGRASASLAEFASKLSKRYDVEVLIDPDLVVVGESIAVDTSRGIDKALDQLTARLPQAAWRQVFRPASGDKVDDAVSLADAARLIDDMAVQSVLVDDVSRRRSVSLEKDLPLKPEILASRQSQEPKTYLVYRTRSAAGEPSQTETRFRNIQQELKSLLQSAPNLGATATESSMLWWTGLAPADLKPLMEKMGAAGSQAWDHVEAGQRDTMIQQFLQTARRAAADIQAAPRDAGRVAAEDHNYRDELQAIAAVIGARFNVKFPVDPAMYLTVRPETPAKTLDLLPAVAKLMAPLAGTQWRRVTVRTRPGNARSEVGGLARFVRFCDRTDYKALAFVDPRTGHAAVLRQLPGATAAPVRDQGSELYLLYAASAADSGQPVAPAERLADLLKRQQQEMLTMNGEQFGRTMEQELRDWQNMGAQDRQSVLSLPMMAGLMAVWMPRQAKERTGQ